MLIPGKNTIIRRQRQKYFALLILERRCCFAAFFGLLAVTSY